MSWRCPYSEPPGLGGAAVNMGRESVRDGRRAAVGHDLAGIAHRARAAAPWARPAQVMVSVVSPVALVNPVVRHCSTPG